MKILKMTPPLPPPKQIVYVRYERTDPSPACESVRFFRLKFLGETRNLSRKTRMLSQANPSLGRLECKQKCFVKVFACEMFPKVQIALTRICQFFPKISAIF